MSPQAGWILQEEICPRIAAVVPRSILCVGAEDHAELVQDGITMAAKMIDRVETQGKLGKVTAGNIAFYTLQHLKMGRRANGSSRIDVLATGTQLDGITEPHSLSEVVNQNEAGEEIFELHDVVASDTEDPATIASRNLDWQAFSGSLTKLEKLLIECLLNGQSLTEAAKQARVHYSTMISYRQKLAVKLMDFMGADILRDIACTPHWQIGLDCERQLLACRADRRN